MREYILYITHHCLNLIIIILLTLPACATAPSLDLERTQDKLLAAWHSDRHGVWDLKWSNAPIAESIIFEAWQVGEKRRYEILEATAPDLVGLVYINDGYLAQHYNRLKEGPQTTLPAAQLPFSPISHAFDLVTEQLSRSPQSIEQVRVPQTNDPLEIYRLHYPSDQTLTLWLDSVQNQIIKLQLDQAHHTLTLTARSLTTLTTLTELHPRLFQVDHDSGSKPGFFEKPGFFFKTVD